MQHLTDFAVSLYQQPEVAPACLKLQDEQGCQIPVLLAYCWHACVIGPMTDMTANAWMDHASTRASSAIEPLRQARTWMKVHWPAAEKIREDIKKAELQLEIRLLQELETLALSSQASPTTCNNIPAQIEVVLLVFSEHYNVTLPENIRAFLADNCLSVAKSEGRQEPVGPGRS